MAAVATRGSEQRFASFDLWVCDVAPRGHSKRTHIEQHGIEKRFRQLRMPPGRLGEALELDRGAVLLRKPARGYAKICVIGEDDLLLDAGLIGLVAEAAQRVAAVD